MALKFPDTAGLPVLSRTAVLALTTEPQGALVNCSDWFGASLPSVVVRRGSAWESLEGLPTTHTHSYVSGNTFNLTRTPRGSVALYWGTGGALSRVNPSRYSVSGKTVTLDVAGGQWPDLQNGDTLIADYLAIDQ